MLRGAQSRTCMSLAMELTPSVPKGAMTHLQMNNGVS